MKRAVRQSRRLLFILWFCFAGLPRQQAQADTIRWGPFRLNLGAQAGFEYTDNFNNSSTNRVSDFSLTGGPIVDGGLELPFTFRGAGGSGEKATLSTSMSYTFKYSLTGNAVQNSFSSPIAVSVRVPMIFAQWQISATDDFSFRNDPLESTVALNTTQAAEYSNNVGLNAMRQFGRFAMTLGTQRTDKFAPDNPQTEETKYQFTVVPSIFLTDRTSVFLANTVGLVYPSDPARSDSQGFSSSVGLSGQITPFLSGVISLGYAHTHLEPIQNVSTNIPAQDIDGLTANLGLAYTHPLRPNTTHALSLSYSPGVTALLNDSNVQESYAAAYSIAHRLNNYVTLTPTVNWTRTADVSKGGAGEVADTIGISVGLSRQITRKISGTLTYRYQQRSSNKASNSYDENKIAVNLTYMF